MIAEIIKEFSSSELSDFEESNLLRYTNLCKIVGEYGLDIRRVVLLIVLPTDDDFGNVSIFSLAPDKKIESLGTRLF